MSTQVNETFLALFRQVSKERVVAGDDITAPDYLISRMAIQRMMEQQCEGWEDFQYFSLGSAIADFIEKMGWNNGKAA